MYDKREVILGILHSKAWNIWSAAKHGVNALQAIIGARTFWSSTSHEVTYGQLYAFSEPCHFQASEGCEFLGLGSHWQSHICLEITFDTSLKWVVTAIAVAFLRPTLKKRTFGQYKADLNERHAQGKSITDIYTVSMSHKLWALHIPTYIYLKMCHQTEKPGILTLWCMWVYLGKPFLYPVNQYAVFPHSFTPNQLFFRCLHSE